MYRPKPKDFARMKDLIRGAVAQALPMEGVRETVIERYMADAGEIEFSRTANRGMVAKRAFAPRYSDTNAISETHGDTR